MSVTHNSGVGKELRVTPQQAALLRATLRFANARRLTSTRWVENLFKRASTGLVFRTIKPHKVKAYRRDKDDLCEWLTAIAAGRGADVTGAISRGLGTLDVTMRFNPHRQTTEAVYLVQGVQAAYTFACALLLDRVTKLAKLLSVCAAPGCGRFVLDLELRPGALRQHCNDAHRRAADRPRATKYMRDRRQAERKEKEAGKG